MTNTTSHWEFDDFLVPQDMSDAVPATILGMPDSIASVVVPIMAYWVVSGFYEAADYFDWFPAYRTFPSSEEQKRNLVSRWKTLRSVLTMHAVQTIFGFSTIYLLPKPKVVQTWGDVGSVAYFGLGVKSYIPVFAAAYNHPVEGFFNDILGFFFSALLVGLSDSEATVLYTAATVKVIDDHASLELPYNPLRIWGWLFGNGMVHHTIHHQAWGLKTNYGFYFTVWDRWNNTLYNGKRRLTEAKENQLAERAIEAKKND
ncbi:hypothetical protein K4F52_003361 [Lecanicillium sp. MT-2017a]|nr:hypothetical protein K4F52_003361 [Lecanicillium sp. MT-2017a]